MSELVPIGEVIHFDIITSNPSTGAASDADATPTFDVFEEDTDTAILSAQNFTKRSGLTGNYRGVITASSANGFEAGKWYNVIAYATVNSVAAKAVVRTFRMGVAEGSPGIPVVDSYALDWNTTESPGNLVVRTPDGATIIYTKTLTSAAPGNVATGAS